MNLIERAAQRLREAGSAVAPQPAPFPAMAPAATPAASSGPAPMPASPTFRPVVSAPRAVPDPSDTDAAERRPSAVRPVASQPQGATEPASNGRKRIVLDLGRLQADGFVTPEGPRTRIAEEFRHIKRPLLNAAASGTANDAAARGNMIMVTSAVPGEGKTFTSVNLALSIASERDLHVLLVDADVLRPSVFRVLQVEPERGLLDLLSQPGLDVGDVLLRTQIPNLSLMAAGRSTLPTTELLASQRMANLMTDIANRYRDRIIIFDAPPVLASTEPAVLVRHVGQTVFVIEAGRTGRRTVEEAVRVVSACPRVSLVLNKSPPTKRDRYGAYPYYEPAA